MSFDFSCRMDIGSVPEPRPRPPVFSNSTRTYSLPLISSCKRSTLNLGGLVLPIIGHLHFCDTCDTCDTDNWRVAASGFDDRQGFAVLPPTPRWIVVLGPS